MTLHVVLWFWRGWRPVYTWRHVNAMVRMLRPNLPAGARILCLSDQPQIVWHPAECEVHPLWDSPVQDKVMGGRPNCFLRLKIFDPNTQQSLGIQPGDIVMSVDMDGIVDGPLAPLLRVLVPDGDYDGPDCSYWPSFAAMAGKASRIHGALFAFRAGTHAELWTKFHPQLSPIECATPMRNGQSRPVGSDQAWMSRKVKGEHLWQPEDGVYSWNRHGLSTTPRHTAGAAYWSFAGPNKPWSDLVRETRPDLYETYMAAYGEQ